jgi:hypothetical protein
MRWLFILFILVAQAGLAQRSQNIIIITLDGFRWQEMFRGMDSAIANNSKFHQGDSNYLFKKYWSKDEQERRKKLMPFVWNTIGKNGQLYGNRGFDNKVDNANPFWFSYPGYNEIMTGYADTAIDSNDDPDNPNITILEFFNWQKPLRGKVAAFGAWEAFDRILNEKRSGVPVFSAFDKLGGIDPNNNEILLNNMLQDSHKPWLEDECFDLFTHYGAMEYLKKKKPAVLYIAYGETDEWAHGGEYRSYLDAAHQIDKWINDIWNFAQSHPQYKGKTTLFITTDHGRGDKEKEKWTSHNNKVQDSHEIWFAAIGPGIKPLGEIKKSMQLYQEQFAQTFARLMGYKFTANHPVAGEVKEIFNQ